MPTYDYQCDKCGHTFEEFQSMSDPLLEKCPKCKKKSLRRLFGTGAAILFKGSGFYETDYRSETYKQAAKADQEASSKTTAPATDTSTTNGTTSSDKGTKSPGQAGKTPKSST